jgi:hypothetical protein
MKRSIKKISALFLAVVMIATVASVSALAANTYGDYYTISTDTYGTVSRLFVTDKTKVPENVVIPDGVTSIANYAFCDIPQLKTVTVPTSVTEFEKGAFGSDSITDIYYKGTEVQWHAIENSKRVPSSITIHYEGGTGNSPSFLTIENGVLTRCNTAAIGEITVPSGVTTIGDSAFYKCQYITSIILPEGVTSINYGAFCDCWKLTSITIPSTLKSIGRNAFDGFNKLTDIYFGGSQSQWEAIMQNAVGSVTSALANVSIHYGKTDSTPSNDNSNTTVAKARFKDVATTAYYNNSVNWAIQNGITNGTTDTTFSPNDTCTTAQIITFLYRAAGSPSHNNTNSYGVTNKSLYYYDALCWASENLIVTSTTFNPYEKCTRATVLLYMYRAAGSPYITKTANFSDMPTGETSWAITWAVNNGITNGIGNNQFGPDLTVTRAQAVTFMYREQN